MINVEIANFDSANFSKIQEKIIKKAACLILTSLFVIDGHFLAINIVTPQQIKTLNNRYRRRDKASSILSFAEPKKFINPPGINPLGEIFLCPKKIKNDAKKLKIHYGLQLVKLLIHGVLHLKGHTHNTARERKLMEQKETKIFRKLNRTMKI